MTQNVETLIVVLKSKIPAIPENKHIHDKIEAISKEKDLVKQYEILTILIALIPSAHIISEKFEIIEKKIDALIISLKPGIREELTVTVGAELFGTGVQHVITIPLQAISYPELKEDLGKIKEKSTIKLASLPQRLAHKVKDYLIKTKQEDLLEQLS